MTNPILYETHSHTPLCKHAVGRPEEYAAAAHRRGLKGIIFTCHNPMPRGFSPRIRMAVEQFHEYLEMVARARSAWAGRVDVLLGLEADYFPGFEPWLKEQLSSSDFHYVLGSVHPHLDEFHERFAAGGEDDFRRAYFNQLAAAAETGLFDCLAHPDLIKNEIAGAWDPDEALEDVRPALDRIARVGIAMELNTSGANKKIAEMNPFPAMLREMQQREIPVVVGADAHEPDRVGDGFAEALDLIEAAGYECVSLFTNRHRREIPLAQARASLMQESFLPEHHAAPG